MKTLLWIYMAIAIIALAIVSCGPVVTPAPDGKAAEMPAPSSWEGIPKDFLEQERVVEDLNVGERGSVASVSVWVAEGGTVWVRKGALLFPDSGPMYRIERASPSMYVLTLPKKKYTTVPLVTAMSGTFQVAARLEDERR